MAHRKLDRVQQTTTWTGVGGLALDGPAPARMRTFADTLSNGDTCWVLIEHQTAAEWEISLATYNAGAITRFFALGSTSTTGGLVNFSAGWKTVSLIAPAGATPIVDGSGNLNVPGSVVSAGVNSSGPILASMDLDGAADVVVGNSHVGGSAQARILVSGGTAFNYMIASIRENGGGTPYAEFSYGSAVGMVRHAINSPGGYHEFWGGDVRPATDNFHNLGSGSYRFGTVFAGTPTISTSDESEKQDFAAPSAALLAFFRALAADVSIFRYKSSVQAKGDAARYHVGWIAQRVIALAADHGLDALSYGFVGFDKVYEYRDVIGEDGAPVMENVGLEKTDILGPDGSPVMRPVTRKAQQQVDTGRVRYNVRMEELLAGCLAALAIPAP